MAFRVRESVSEKATATKHLAALAIRTAALSYPAFCQEQLESEIPKPKEFDIDIDVRFSRRLAWGKYKFLNKLSVIASFQAAGFYVIVKGQRCCGPGDPVTTCTRSGMTRISIQIRKAVESGRAVF